MSKADPFSVWGAPPEALTKDLTQAQIKLLKRYAQAIGESTYRMAFDNGANHGLQLVEKLSRDAWEKQKARYR